MSVFLGILAGMALPIQTSINAGLRKKMRSPYLASFISFGVALLFLIALLLFTGQGLSLPIAQLTQEPLWIWIGGICGVVFVTGNILLFSKLGSVQTVIFPVLGEILMGLLIDTFGLFNSTIIQLTFVRILGTILVATGIITVSLAKKIKKGNLNTELKEEAATLHPIKTEKNDKWLWIWRIFAIVAGMLCAVQIAVNGYLGRVVASPLKASTISFAVGFLLLAIICLIRHIKHTPPEAEPSTTKSPWWIWFGGLVGGISVLINVYLSGLIGPGITVIFILIGSTTGGILVDAFGLFNAQKQPLNIMKIIGVIIMLLGIVMIKLF